MVNKEINIKANKILSTGKVLVNVRVESENSTFYVVRNDGTDYFLRFIGSDCYVVVKLDDCVRMPVKTIYESSCKYVLYGTNCKIPAIGQYSDENKVVFISNNIDYLLNNSKAYWSFYKHLFVVDKEINEVVVKIEKSENEYKIKKYLSKDLIKHISCVIGSLVEEFNFRSSRRCVKMTSIGNDIYFVDTSGKRINISDSKNIYEVNSIILKLESTFGSELESILFVPSHLAKVSSHKITGYCRDSDIEHGKVRIVLE